ncbi:unnamed protein product [Ectocarpus fasciculatus]
MLPTAWADLASDLHLPPADAAAALATIQTRYAEPWRSYHDLTHIEELLALSAQHRDRIQDVTFVNLSIIFHDIIYYVDSRSPDNENLSADLFVETLGSKMNDKDLLGRVDAAIRATKSHAVADTAHPDLKLFMDFDMAILAAPRSKYALYAKNIRKEYESVEKNAYCAGRSGFFRNYLQSTEHIYASELFRESCEAAARSNIAWECGVLESGRLVQEVDI